LSLLLTHRKGKGTVVADEMKAIRKALIAQGWRIEPRKGGHDVAWPPDRTKRQVPLPSTPGGGRWRANLIADLRRSGFEWPPKGKGDRQ
jgi:predicted RNA binding protein YcfA (HicA-like mRNA interferase family)